MTFRGAIIAGCAILAAIPACFEACNNPVGTSNPVLPAGIKIDTVDISQIPGSESLSLYEAEEDSWGLELDTAKADSLATWFAHSGLRIEEMWFPASGPVCAIPFRTFNYVIVGLAGPDISIGSVGFAPVTLPGHCFPTWRRFTFIWPRAGG